MSPGGLIIVSAHAWCAVDHNRFFEQVSMFIVLQRLQVVYDVVTNEVYAAKVFNAHSNGARIKVIHRVLVLQKVGPEPPPAERGH